MTETAVLTHEQVASQIEEDVLEAKGRKIKRRARHALSGSDIDDPCLRYLYYSIANWQDRALHDAGTQALFDEGNVLAQASQQDLRAADYRGDPYRLEEQETTFSIRVRNGVVTGHIDWFLTGGVLGDERVPVEHKGLSYGRENSWATWRDMLHAKQRWVKRYPGQLQLYLLQSDSPWGLFAIRGKETARLKFLSMDIELNFCERLLQRAEIVYAALEEGKPPDRIAYLPRFCDFCDFVNICDPVSEWAGSDIITDDRCLNALRRRTELAATRKEYEEADTEAKAFFAAVEEEREWRCGEFIITRSSYRRNGKGFWKTNIEELKSHD